MCAFVELQYTQIHFFRLVDFVKMNQSNSSEINKIGLLWLKRVNGKKDKMDN